MRRRQFISLAAGAVAAHPLAALAQQAMPMIGFLHSGAAEQNVKRLEAFRKGLGDTGFVEGRNVAVEYRWAGGQSAKLPALAADLILRNVTLIATPGSTPAAVVAKAATATIPIVFGVGADPVELGLVASLSRPGGNVTGSTSMNADLAAKRFGLLRDLVPKASKYFTMVNPTSQLAGPQIKDVQRAAAGLGIQVEIVRASTDSEIEAAFARMAEQPGSVVISGADSFFYIRRAHIAELALRHALPTIFDVREYVDAGALLSYGGDFLNVMELAGNYAGRILKGEKPADLPVQQTAKFELTINMKTAHALGIEVPPRLLFTADAVVE